MLLILEILQVLNTPTETVGSSWSVNTDIYEGLSRAFRFLVCLKRRGNAETYYLARKRGDAKTKGRENEKKGEKTRKPF